MSGFTWVPFYMEFAGKLLTYQFDRPAMVQKVIKAYAQAELKMPRLDSTDIPWIWTRSPFWVCSIKT